MSAIELKIDALFGAFSETSPGCAAAVVRDGEVVFAKGYGMADLEQGVAFTPRSACYMASVSKQFTALAILLLVEDGRLELDGLVRAHVPELPDCAADITVRQLLTHTSGLRDYFALGYLSGLSSEHVYTEAGVLRLLSRQEGLNFEPGAEFMYSNSGYVLLSILVQRVSGQTLDAFARERIFGPLGMAATHFQHDHSTPVPHKAHGYELRGGEWHVSDSMLDVVGDGGMYSSLEDMSRWMKNFERPVVGAEALALMAVAARRTNGDGTGYGMGLAPGRYRGLKVVEHAGGLAGYRTKFTAFPDENLSVVVLSNSGAADPSKLAMDVAEVFIGERMGEPAATPPAPEPPTGEPVPAETAAACVGDYESPELQSIYRVASGPDGLSIAFGESAPPLTLRSLGEDLMQVGPIAAEIRFLRDADGRITGFLLSSNAGRVANLAFRRV
ncbi:MAG TPA: serine hydrolase domain-containing protein [Caulobacteraceae bacterium]|jgi:CubicO group peptidase (beta-lactamase class C family)|nr:serine hydrolase domain-containing protein [Caulobacteraceae bacterium]